MMDPALIARAVPADLDGLAPLFESYRRFYQREPEPTRVRAFLADRLRNRDSIVFLARLAEGDEPVGFTQLYPVFSSISVGRALILNDLFVAERARGHGVGRALLERAAAFGRETGALYLELSTGVDNATAQRLYRAAGWRRESGFDHYQLDLRSPPGRNDGEGQAG
jgi:GNAT superfamily N-acetyltransferase